MANRTGHFQDALHALVFVYGFVCQLIFGDVLENQDLPDLFPLFVLDRGPAKVEKPRRFARVEGELLGRGLIENAFKLREVVEDMVEIPCNGLGCLEIELLFGCGVQVYDSTFFIHDDDRIAQGPENSRS